MAKRRTPMAGWAHDEREFADGADRQEAAFARRLDRLSWQAQRLERNVGTSIETLALFIGFWLTITPPLPSDAQAAAQLKGRQRYEGFVEALGQRLQKGQSLLHEIPDDVDSEARPEAHDDTPDAELSQRAPSQDR